MRQNKFDLLLILILLLGFGLACSSDAGEKDDSTQRAEKTKSVAAAREPQKLESYTLRGLKFSYYKIPAGLSRNELIKTAQEIHEQEPDAQLILVDDSGVAGYINYAQEISKGNSDTELPKEWADKHIVANVQKLMSGKFRLYESYGYKEIADLE